MGIELPTPRAEAPYAPQNSAEQSAGSYASGRAESLQYVERNATEHGNSTEVRTGQGAGDTPPQNVSDDANAATNIAALPASQPIAQPTVALLDDVPVVAADEDLIEKQWVDSAKRIIHDTRTDPYKQGEAISRLQADYLQKRYGKTLADGGN